MVDLDYFKQINDRYGHAVGDDALVHFCDVARRLIRDEDLLARYGGEEFVIVLNFTGRDGACEMAQRLLDALARQPLALDKQPPLYYTASIGIATLSPRHANCEALLKSADEAVYRAKSLGRNRFEQVD
jgi:diguanylate cyclase (GGDEF)-like protein